MSDWIDSIVITICVLGVIGLIAAIIGNEVWWAKYSVSHHCVTTGQSRSETWVQYNSKGNLVSAIPESNIEYEYSCDDDTIHWH